MYIYMYISYACVVHNDYERTGENSREKWSS